jgi:hypothetical protein
MLAGRTASRRRAAGSSSLPGGPAARLALLTATLAACASAKPECAPWRGKIDNGPSREEIAEADVVSMQFCGGLGGAAAGTASPLAVREIHIDALKQPGAFSYPYEG